MISLRTAFTFYSVSVRQITVLPAQKRYMTHSSAWQQKQDLNINKQNQDENQDDGCSDVAKHCEIQSLDDIIDLSSTTPTNYYSSLANKINENGEGSTTREEPPGQEIEIRNNDSIVSAGAGKAPATHYFDTSKIYTSLRFSGYTEGQADIITRSMREILEHNLEECKDGSIQQSGFDNESYLFKAACSELMTEVQKSRETQAAEYNSNLGRLQRDVEISNQELNESILTMKSGIDLDINERKHVSRSEASLIDMKMQRLNNRISIDIVSDFKSEIEALRWQITRRALLAVVFVATVALVGISVGKKDEKNAEKQRQIASSGVEFAVPIFTSAEDDLQDLEERRFAVELLNENESSK